MKGVVEMSMPERGELRYRALADPTRRHLLRILDDVAGPMHPRDLGDRLGLHVNTIRGHLDLLARAELVERVPVPRRTPGRPQIMFRALHRDARSPTSEGYRFLAEILASSIQANSDDPRRTAVEAGRTWGRFLVDRPPPSSPMSPKRVVEQIVETLAELGFEPESRRDEHNAEIRLHDCPFRQIAQTRGEIVCAVHEGLLRGMLEEMGDTVGVDSLEPFVEPSLCVARISDR
jgi:predicted ArsR family transcriptional regulator